MPIVFQGIDDPFGLRAASGSLAQALMQKNLLNRQEQSTIAGEQRAEEATKRTEERALNRQLATEQRAKLQREQYGGVLKEAMDIVADPKASTLQKVGALQQYATISGDQKGIAPILTQILKDASRQQESASAIDFLRGQGIDISETSSLPPASFLGSYAQGLKPTYEPEGDKIEARRTADVADRIVKDYEGAEVSKNRLAQMKIGAQSGQLPTPAMVKTMEHFGVPLSVYANPASEAYEKNVNEFIKDVSNYFPGQIRVSEIEYYMKAIPTLLNSDEGKMVIIENQELINRQKEAAYDAYRQILKENNGRKPRNLDVEILERTREVRAETAEKLKDNFERAVQMSKFPTQKVSPGTKITVDVARNYFNRAGGDKLSETPTIEELRAVQRKAEELARGDGYEL